MKNKEKYNLAHLHIVEHTGTTRLDGYITYVEIEYGGRIIKEYSCLDVEVSKKFFEWLEKDDGKECKPIILTDKEKAYLSAVIKPFRKDVKYIKKMDYVIRAKEYLLIKMRDLSTAALPLFEKETMYKGMEANKAYTLEELEL